MHAHNMYIMLVNVESKYLSLDLTTEWLIFITIVLRFCVYIPVAQVVVLRHHKCGHAF